ncbi:uncharacterized protein LOC135823567 [Sycon ciliatum]|uniref:uncharacterized protein LOC135823567 n=1 Tax=Sycon ciliatum TaxID=27933 RepID=UPI0031F6730A
MTPIHCWLVLAGSVACIFSTVMGQQREGSDESMLAPRFSVSSSSVWFIGQEEKVFVVSFDVSNVNVSVHFAEVGRQRASWSLRLEQKGWARMLSVKLSDRIIAGNMRNPYKTHTLHMVIMAYRQDDATKRPLYSYVLPVQLTYATHRLLVTTNRMVYKRGENGSVSAVLMSRSMQPYQSSVSCTVKARKGTGQPILTLDGYTPVANGLLWQAQLTTSLLPSDVHHFLVQCIARSKRPFASFSTFTVVDHEETDLAYQTDLVGRLKPFYISSSQTATTLESWLESVQAVYPSLQAASGTSHFIAGNGRKISEENLRPNGKLPNTAGLAQAISAALDLAPPGTQGYLVVQDSLSAATRKVPVPVFADLPELACTAPVLNISTSRYFANDILRITVCASSCSDAPQVAALRIVAFRDGLEFARRQRTIPTRDFDAQNCYITQQGTGTAHSLQVSVTALGHAVQAQRATLVNGDAPVQIHFGRTNCTRHMRSSSCVVWLHVSHNPFLGYIVYQVSSGPSLIHASSGRVQLNAAGQIALKIPVRAGNPDTLRVAAQLHGLRLSEMAFAHRTITVSRSHSRSLVRKNFVVLESSGDTAQFYPSSNVDIKLHAPQGADVYVTARPVAQDCVLRGDDSCMDLRQQQVHGQQWEANCLNTKIVYAHTSDYAVRVEGNQASHKGGSCALQPSLAEDEMKPTWDVSSPADNSWFPRAVKLGSSGEATINASFPMVFGSFVLQAVARTTAGVKFSNLVSVQGKLPAPADILVRLDLPQQTLRGGVQGLVTCNVQTKVVNLHGLRATVQLENPSNIPMRISARSKSVNILLAGRHEIVFEVTATSGGAGALSCSVSAGGFTWRHTNPSVSILVSTCPARCAVFCASVCCSCAVHGPRM